MNAFVYISVRVCLSVFCFCFCLCVCVRSCVLLCSSRRPMFRESYEYEEVSWLFIYHHTGIHIN